jgi:hypothetical protein
MSCERCGTACANRTESRRVKLAGKHPFLCNVCSAHAVAGSGRNRESIRGVRRASPQSGDRTAPPLAG